MNLHGIVAASIGAVNPFVVGSIQYSTGYTTDDSGAQQPQYTNVTGVSMQVQALTYRDLQQVEGLNLNGTRRAIYLYGVAQGVVRSLSKGGDLITLPDGSIWLIAQMLEQWPDWCKAVCTLQDD